MEIPCLEKSMMLGQNICVKIVSLRKAKAEAEKILAQKI